MKPGYRRIMARAIMAALLMLAGVTAARAQEAGTVVGEVREAGTDRPLPGAQVVAAGTGLGTISNARGEFRLAGVPPGEAAIRVELLGHAPAERRVSIPAGGTTRADFALTPRPLELDAVVVTGTAGGARRRTIGHSVSRLDVDRIAEPVGSVDNLLAARVPGLTVLQSSGMAGSGSQIRLRGSQSVALSDQPMVYVDGIRIRSEGYPKNVPPVGSTSRSGNDVPSPLNDLNPIDIERVEIIKGPAATTLYGTEAAAGVIQIFTRRGLPGPPLWTVQVDQGFDHLQSFGTDASPFFGLDPWIDTAWRQRYALSVSGGGDLLYYVSGLYDHNGGILPNDWERRLGVRGNFEFHPADKLDIRWNASYTNHDISNTPTGLGATSVLINAYRGEENFLGDASKEAIDQLLDYEIFTRIDHLIGGMTAEYRVSPSFTNRFTIGYDRAASELRQLRPFGFVLSPGGVLSNTNWLGTTLTADYLGTFEHAWTQVLRSTFAWGGQSVTSTISSVTGYAETFPGPGEPTLSSGAVSLAFEERNRSTNEGVFGQVLLGYRDRYFLTAGVRVDGHSSFGDRYGLQAYPRLSLSYVLSDEEFWPDRWGRLKIRGAYGQAGRAPDAFAAERVWTSIGFGGQPAVLPAAIGNPRLGPERTAETEIGLEGVFLDDRLTVDLSAFWQQTNDALFPVTQIPSLGFLGTQLQNVGRLRNRGIELDLNATLMNGRRFGWDAGVGLATNHGEMIDLGGAAPLIIEEVGYIQEGQPAPVLIGTLVRNPDEIADPILEEDHVFGPNLPTLTLLLHSTLRLPYGVEVVARGEYQGGHYIHDDASSNLAAREQWPVCADAYDLREEGRADELTAWERVWCDADALPGDGPIYPADYFRLRELTVRAPLPISIPGASDAVLTVSARNYWTWKNDDFLAFDPEMVGDDGMNSAIRVINGLPPPPATITFSLRVVH